MNSKKLKKLNNSSRGFTLVEALVAIMIFTSSILALVVLTGDSIGNVNYVKSKITANYLAQEGLEYIRNVRDTAILEAGGWTGVETALTYCFVDEDGDGSCQIDVFNGSIAPCDGSCDKLLWDDSSGFSYSAGDETIFTRTIFIENLNPLEDGNEELKVVSEVAWEKNNKEHSTTMTAYLKNWADFTGE
jgi:type II secretory pathway pseudopilin PulG